LQEWEYIAAQYTLKGLSTFPCPERKFMLVSLTGFGRAEVNEGTIQYSIEIRSVNGRFLEINTRLPRSLMQFENEVRNVVRTELDRGKVLIQILEPRETRYQEGFSFDKEMVSRVLASIREAADHLALEDDIKLSDILPLLENFKPEETEEEAIRRLVLIQKGLREALKEFDKMRMAEGSNLEKDLRKRLAILEENLSEIKIHAEENRKGQLDKMLTRIEKYTPADKVDKGRLEQEVALLVDRIDITEEIVRMRSHIELFEKALDHGDQVGKRLNFILQEMNRETNTMGSKANTSEVSSRVVRIKEELEKMREQVQNIA
ncbi:YicC family protein, partial [bacterium]|nr:YicC family protein [bacterium]